MPKVVWKAFPRSSSPRPVLHCPASHQKPALPQDHLIARQLFQRSVEEPGQERTGKLHPCDNWTEFSTTDQPAPVPSIRARTSLACCFPDGHFSRNLVPFVFGDYLTARCSCETMVHREPRRQITCIRYIRYVTFPCRGCYIVRDHTTMKSRPYTQTARLRPFEASRCRVYVIELDPSVASDPAFVKANPNHEPGRPCVYVGMTSLDVAERYTQHRTGAKNASRIAGFGQRLRMDLVPPASPTRRTWAKEREKRLARELRSKGFGVWQA